MFGINKLKERVYRLETSKPVSLELFNEMRKHIRLVFEGFDRLPIFLETRHSNAFVIEQLIILVLQQQKDIEELKKK